MTTPMHIYAELAEKYGQVDPKDNNAVNDFFETGVYKLSQSDREDIVDILFSNVDTPSKYNEDLVDNPDS